MLNWMSAIGVIADISADRTFNAAAVLVRIGKWTQPASNEYREEIYDSSIFSSGFVVFG
jgi:hypothetical protein